VTRNGRNQLTIITFLVLLLALLVSATPAAAQNYSFSVPTLRMQVFVQPDASATIIYDITFDNGAFAQEIDIVDIGTPHDGYNLDNFKATMNGVPLTDIRVSEYIDTGVEIHLQGESIPAGGSGTLRVEFTMPDMVYEDTTQADYASLQITPTWFDSSVLRGSSDIWVVVHMLPEVQLDDVLFQDVPFTEKGMFEEHPVVGWRWPDGRADGPYLVGVSFPTTGMTRVIEQTLLDIVIKYLNDNPGAALFIGIGSFVLLALAFFRFTGGTGITVFVLIIGGLGWLLFNNPTIILLIFPTSLILVGLVEWRMAGRKERYLPAIAQVEGGGIKRGLTAPEAAILLELPLNKVLMLVFFGLLDKGAVELVADSPLKVKVQRLFIVMQATYIERKAQRRQIAQEQGVVLRNYEHKFLDILQEDAGKPVHKLEFSEPMKSLIRSVVDRMKGFDLSDTQDYYRKIIARAMAQAKRIGDIPELENHLDKTWPWIFLDNEYDRSFRRRDYQYYPTWVRPYVHTSRSATPSLPSAGKSSPAYGGKTTFSDVAASFAGWTENTTGKLANAISPTALQVKGSGGFINLSGADKVTGDVFKSLATSSGSSGGSSGGSSCACACAGCACACACAGGGR